MHACMGQVFPLLSFDVQRKSGAFSYKVEVGMCVYSDEVQRLEIVLKLRCDAKLSHVEFALQNC
jgi:hypothetical protein